MSAEVVGKNLPVCFRICVEHALECRAKFRIGKYRPESAMQDLSAGVGKALAVRYVFPALEINTLQLSGVGYIDRRRHAINSC